MTVYANEISPALIDQSADRIKALSRSLGEGMGSVVPVSLDLSSESLVQGSKPPSSKGSLDVILWWGSFNMLAGRGRIMSNAFDLLKPMGRLVIMDVYPWEPIPFKYVGAEGSKTLAFLSRSLDMAEDVKRWVTDQWTKKLHARFGHEAASTNTHRDGRAGRDALWHQRQEQYQTRDEVPLLQEAGDPRDPRGDAHLFIK